MPIDYRRYPANWFSEIIPAIRQRSGDCCENCGRVNHSVVYSYVKRLHNGTKYIYRKEWTFTQVDPHPEPAKPVIVILTVAHLDHDQNNHAVKLERLAHWCQLCHLRYDAEQKARRRICGRFCSWPNCYGPDCYDQQW